jgi:DNA mismatch repair protein MutS2
LSLKGKQARVQTGQFTSTVNVSLLEKLDKNSIAKTVNAGVQGVNINERMLSFSHQLDVRGLYPGDAIAQVDEYMDNAILLGAQEVRILHGKGNGVLKTQIRNHLRGYSQVAHLGYDHADRGGEGITIVTLS